MNGLWIFLLEFETCGLGLSILQRAEVIDGDLPEHTRIAFAWIHPEISISSVERELFINGVDIEVFERNLVDETFALVLLDRWYVELFPSEFLFEENILLDVVLNGLLLSSNLYFHRYWLFLLRNLIPPLQSIFNLHKNKRTIRCRLYSILKVNLTAISSEKESRELSLLCNYCICTFPIYLTVILRL